MNNFIAGGCSFTYGSELGDEVKTKQPSTRSWAYKLKPNRMNYICAAKPGAGNSGIARRVFEAVSANTGVKVVVVMWSFLSRYDWAMPRHKSLERTRWASISPWDTGIGNREALKKLSGSEPQIEDWKHRQDLFKETGVKDFADCLYKHAANQYHEIYLSWKSIIWLQNILEKRNIKFMFTLADNSLFYDKKDEHKDIDTFMNSLYKEIDFTKWHFFGDRSMGFNQWALLEEYKRGKTHPLDEAHTDAVKLMRPTYAKLIGE